MNNSKAVVWSKNGCPFCARAKTLLETNGISYEERNISTGEWTREQLLEIVPNAKTVPQIFLGKEYIGGFDQLHNHLSANNN